MFARLFKKELTHKDKAVITIIAFFFGGILGDVLMFRWKMFPGWLRIVITIVQVVLIAPLLLFFALVFYCVKFAPEGSAFCYPL